MIKRTGTVTGPTAAMAVYLQLFNDYSERFLTGTDFVSSFGSKEKFPGLEKGNGCVKDQANHARQFTDTSSLNMFLSDKAFRKIVLGGNYFKINDMEETFSPPPLCSKKGPQSIQKEEDYEAALPIERLFKKERKRRVKS